MSQQRKWIVRSAAVATFGFGLYLVLKVFSRFKTICFEVNPYEIAECNDVVPSIEILVLIVYVVLASIGISGVLRRSWPSKN
jgi:hypothetical protein